MFGWAVNQEYEDDSIVAEEKWDRKLSNKLFIGAIQWRTSSNPQNSAWHAVHYLQSWLFCPPELLHRRKIQVNTPKAEANSVFKLLNLPAMTRERFDLLSDWLLKGRVNWFLNWLVDSQLLDWLVRRPVDFMVGCLNFWWSISIDQLYTVHAMVYRRFW